MSEAVVDDIVAVLPPLLQSLEALAFVARHLNPPEFAAVMEAAGEPDQALQAVRPRLAGWPESFAHIRAASSAMKATMGTLKSVRPTDYPSIGVPWLLEAASATNMAVTFFTSWNRIWMADGAAGTAASGVGVSSAGAGRAGGDEDSGGRDAVAEAPEATLRPRAGSAGAAAARLSSAAAMRCSAARSWHCLRSFSMR